MACNFRPNETLKHNPKNLPLFNFLFLLHMTPTPSMAQKKALDKLLLLSYYTTQKKRSGPKYFFANVRSCVFKRQSKNARYAATGHTDTGMCTAGGLSILTKLGCEEYFCRVTYLGARGCSNLPCYKYQEAQVRYAQTCQVACSLLDTLHPKHGFCLPSALLEKACGSY